MPSSHRPSLSCAVRPMCLARFAKFATSHTYRRMCLFNATRRSSSVCSHSRVERSMKGRERTMLHSGHWRGLNTCRSLCTYYRVVRICKFIIPVASSACSFRDGIIFSFFTLVYDSRECHRALSCVSPLRSCDHPTGRTALAVVSASLHNPIPILVPYRWCVYKPTFHRCRKYNHCCN
jgi:hypothetical protein